MLSYLNLIYNLYKIKKDRTILLSNAFVDKLKKSIKNQGLMKPIMVNQKLEIIDGRHRLKACEELGVAVKYTFL